MDLINKLVSFKLVRLVRFVLCKSLEYLKCTVQVSFVCYVCKYHSPVDSLQLENAKCFERFVRPSSPTIEI